MASLSIITVQCSKSFGQNKQRNICCVRGSSSSSTAARNTLRVVCACPLTVNSFDRIKKKKKTTNNKARKMLKTPYPDVLSLLVQFSHNPNNGKRLIPIEKDIAPCSMEQVCIFHHSKPDDNILKYRYVVQMFVLVLVFWCGLIVCDHIQSVNLLDACFFFYTTYDRNYQ